MKSLMTLALGMLSLTLWAQPGNPERGKEAAKVCFACHMEDGRGKENPPPLESWPRLAGLPAAYIEKQLLDFREGRRVSVSMQPFSGLLNEQQTADVAAYYASLPLPPPEALPPADDVMALGEKLALRGDWDRYLPPCMACHGPNNAGAGVHFPALAGQHAGYLRKQLQLWQEDQRQNDVNQLMAVVAKRLTAADIEAVAAWLARQGVQP